ncbi:MAG: hypothetical protein WA192_18155 [Candidatus Acidiferrales bacterium]
MKGAACGAGAVPIPITLLRAAANVAAIDGAKPAELLAGFSF